MSDVSSMPTADTTDSTSTHSPLTNPNGLTQRNHVTPLAASQQVLADSSLESAQPNRIAPLAASQQVSQVLLFNLSDLQDPPWNPRRYLDEAKMADLTAYVTAGGPIPPLTIWKGNGQTPWFVISGKRRREAYRRAGKTQIEGIVLDISLQNAKILAIASNQDDKPYWLDEYVAVESLLREDDDLEQRELAKQLGWSDFWVTRAVNLTNVLNPASRRLIEQSLRKSFRPSKKSTFKNPENSAQKAPWVLTEKVAYRLTLLLDHYPKKEAQPLAEKALGIILTRQLTGPQTDELMAHIIAGGDLTQFKPTTKVRKAKTAVTAKPSADTLTGRPNQAPTHLATDGKVYSAQTQEQAAPTPVSPETKITSPAGTQERDLLPIEILARIFAIGILWGLGWLAWKAILWVIHLI